MITSNKYGLMYCGLTNTKEFEVFFVDPIQNSYRKLSISKLSELQQQLVVLEPAEIITNDISLKQNL